MIYTKAEEELLKGNKIKLPEWNGYWFYDPEAKQVKVRCGNGDILDTPYEACKSRNDWEITNGQVGFGGAIKMLANGKCVARKGWNDKGMFVCKQVPSEIYCNIIPKMSSLPKAAKDMLYARDESIHYENQMIIIKPDNIIDSWVPSSSDIFAEDWVIVE